MTTHDTEPEQGQPVEILLVEDNPGDVRLTQKALSDSRMLNNLSVVNDGVEAMEYLRNGDPRPDLVLLDLNMPRMDGQEVLAEMKGDEALRRIPVIVLTSSAAEEDVVRSYDLHANAYLTKPVEFDQFAGVVKGIEQFWFSLVKFPSEQQ